MSRRFLGNRGTAGLVLTLLVGVAAPAQARDLMAADGPGGVATYTLLGRAYSIEVPDCGHMVPHITEEHDDELGKPVFVFHAHVALDDDRCTATDRQRTEIRGGKLATIVGQNGETVHYRWKFKLPVGFQSQPNFTHIFQIKSDAGTPVMTLTPRNNATIAIDGGVGERGKVALAPFIGAWVVVDLTVLYGTAGHLAMTIRRMGDGQTLLSYAGAADTWQASDTGHDPKFGIYRSLLNPSYLRDEQVRFADFCVSKVSAAECDDGLGPPPRDAGAPPADTAPVVPPDAAVVPPPKLDAPVVIPPPDAAVVPPPKLDAPVVIPPPDAAVVPPPKLDAPVVIPPPDAAVPPARDAAASPPADALVIPPRLDAAATSTRPADATVTPGPPDASAPDLAEPEPTPIGPTNVGETSSGRARRPGGATGCALAPTSDSPGILCVLLGAAVLTLTLRRQGSRRRTWPPRRSAT